METLIIEGVRCFRDEQLIPIRPLTLLVGENSTGKSTVLAMLRSAWDVGRLVEPNFNEDPFSLGSYNTIAHYHGGQAKRAHHFDVGSTSSVKFNGVDETRTVRARFEEHAGQPRLARWEAKQKSLWIQFEIRSGGVSASMKSGSTTLIDKVPIDAPVSSVTTDLSLAVFELISKSRGAGHRKIEGELERLLEIMGVSKRRTPRPVSSAPIRSKAERTYDPRRDLPEPGGSHVPMRLATMHSTVPEEFAQLATQIGEYGAAAGLFTKLNVKRLGRQPGDPFQVVVTVDKHAFNLTDVGYGVSQILPILFDTLAAPSGQTFLLQQPEVHLHPRAQAELGSMLVTQAASRQQTFVVETHSDHLVDRVRMDVRERRGSKPLSHNDVMILYFSRAGGRATVHPIEIDDAGELVDVPTGYREFFMREERRFLGIS